MAPTEPLDPGQPEIQGGPHDNDPSQGQPRRVGLLWATGGLFAVLVAVVLIAALATRWLQ
jgi:hypothetical protein